MLTTHLEEIIAINSARLIKSSEKHRIGSCNPEKNESLRNWIYINKSKLNVKNSIPRRRTNSLDNRTIKETDQRFVSFENQTIDFFLKNKPKARCNSTGNSAVSFVEEYLPRNICRTETKTREMEGISALRGKTEGNLIKGLKTAKFGFPIKKNDQGTSSFLIRGIKLK